jgi:hypothetical protein
MSFTNFTTDRATRRNVSGNEAPRAHSLHPDKFDDPNLPGEMQTTIILKQVFCGTDLSITQERIPAAIPARRAISAGRDR